MRLASWMAPIAVSASDLHREVCVTLAKAERYGAPATVQRELRIARDALHRAELCALTLTPQTTVEDE